MLFYFCHWCCGKKFKGGRSKFEIEKLIIEYIDYIGLIYYIVYNRIQCKSYCKLMTQ